MKEKFTSAPWEWAHDNETACTISVFNFNSVEICRLQSEDDAHLIAAAPKMYKFLDDLANGRGTDYPIEKLLAEARGEG